MSSSELGRVGVREALSLPVASGVSSGEAASQLVSREQVTARLRGERQTGAEAGQWGA